MFNVNDWIIIEDIQGFINEFESNRRLLENIGHQKIKILALNSNGGCVTILANGLVKSVHITRTELVQYFKLVSSEEPNTTQSTKFSIILTYIENDKTLSEEGVFDINLTHDTITYKYNRKKLGFLTYKGEVALKIDELKQITINSDDSSRVFHIENGIVVRQHVMYDGDRKFKSFNLTTRE